MFKSYNLLFASIISSLYRLGEDIQSKVLAFAFGLSAEIERTLISQRTKEALAACKVDKGTLGRYLRERMADQAPKY